MRTGIFFFPLFSFHFASYLWWMDGWMNGDGACKDGWMGREDDGINIACLNERSSAYLINLKYLLGFVGMID